MTETGEGTVVFKAEFLENPYCFCLIGVSHDVDGNNIWIVFLNKVSYGINEVLFLLFISLRINDKL
ncbi:MAG: hypothetical protein IKE77_01570 [Erysipelotrichaceae bacterium]|nr:hypothetical protein [Erysipelotrichaceae bacterium]